MLIKERKVVQRTGQPGRGAPVDGVPLGEAIKNYRLWAIWLIFLVGSSCTLALVPQLPTMLADRGFTPADAARGASVLGIGLLAGRLLTGMLLDRIHAPLVACAFFVAGALGIFLLRASHDYSALLCAAGLAGGRIGAEGDLFAYLVRSTFGLGSFGTLYGLCFSGYGLGAGIGPVAIGAYFDRYGNYDQALVILPVLLLIACGLTLTLGRYRDASERLGDVTSSQRA